MILRVDNNHCGGECDFDGDDEDLENDDADVSQGAGSC